MASASASEAGAAGGARGPRAGAGAGACAGEAAATRPLHPRSFKLRFAACREPGRSYVSLVKPRALPATVTGKFYSRAGAEADEAQARADVARIEEMFARGPRDLYPAPVTAAHQYGWWCTESAERREERLDRRLDHRIRDSAWLKARLRVLAADDRLKPR